MPIARMPLVAGRQEERFDTKLAVRLEHGSGLVRNVSANGIYFVTDVALEEGAAVRFTLEFADFPGGPIRADCTARIVRVEEQGMNTGVGAAIKSLELHRLAKPGALA